LERGFMIARNRLCRSTGWRSMPKFTRESAARIFLSVSVLDQNLA
jgi:hypothetical protein